MNSAVLHSFAFVKGASFLSAFLFLFLAGCGASIRWRLQNLHLWDSWISTVCVNIFSSFFIGFLIAANPASEVVTILGVGFLGSLSTFSTIIMQSAKAIEDRDYWLTVMILGLNIILGVLFAYIGLRVG
ncbi:MAG: CrcB family protein [Actinomycetota bacterium]|nr:CrcB family protein [Actinomycetota bacterium]